MSVIPKKVVERFTQRVPKFQKILKSAFSRDINESDTVMIIEDMLTDIFSYDKYEEITSEYAIRNTYCDLAIKINDKIQFLIEVKSIGTKLKDEHLRQAIDYGANHGAQWVLLTNSIDWQLYKIKFERPISHELVTSINFLELNPRKKDDQEILFVLTKEGLGKSAREQYYERVQCINRYVISGLILSDPILNTVKKYLKKLSEGIKIEDGEIEDIIKNEIIKRDVIDDEEFPKILSKMKKITRTTSKSKKVKKQKTEANKENLPDA